MSTPAIDNSEKSKLRRLSFVLKICVFATGCVAIVTEYTLATLVGQCAMLGLDGCCHIAPRGNCLCPATLEIFLENCKKSARIQYQKWIQYQKLSFFFLSCRNHISTVNEPFALINSALESARFVLSNALVMSCGRITPRRNFLIDGLQKLREIFLENCKKSADSVPKVDSVPKLSFFFCLAGAISRR